MSKLKAVLALVGLSAAIVLVVACSNGVDTPAGASGTTPPGESAENVAPTVDVNEAGFTTAFTTAGDVASGTTQLGEILENVARTLDVNEVEALKALLALTTIVSSETETGSISAPTVSEVVGVEQPATVGMESGVARVVVSESASSVQPSVVAQVGALEGGIRVSGEGSITMAPDLAMLNIGVEATAPTVSEARQEAAMAMNAIVDALHSRDIEDKDIRTRFFNISPRYDFQEVLEGGIRSRKQVLVGYMVSNSASIKIRDLDAVGAIVDDVAEAGGNATRINGISFTVEDPSPFMVSLREEAVMDALARAQQFADLTGVTLGRLVLISESGRGAPVIGPVMERAMFAQAAPAPTQISGGELELRMTVQAVFDIL